MSLSSIPSFPPTPLSSLSKPPLFSLPTLELVATHQVSRRKNIVDRFGGFLFLLNDYNYLFSLTLAPFVACWLGFPTTRLLRCSVLTRAPSLEQLAPWPARLDRLRSSPLDSLYSVILAIPPKRPKFLDPRTMDAACDSHAGMRILCCQRCRSVTLKDVACRRTSFLCV